MARSNSYSWMPGWLRKFLNLDDEMPSYGAATSSTSREYSASNAAPARPAASFAPSVTYTPPASSATYTPPAPSATYTPSSPAPAFQPLTQGTPAAETTPRFTSSYSPPPPPSLAPTPRSGEPVASPSSYVAGTAGEGYVQPIGYGLRSYARGVLPPQGLEQFTREFRATMTDVWNLYSYWTRFQTDELVRMGKEAVDVVLDNLPSSPGEPASSSGGARRIKVTVGNGNGEKKIDRVATTSTIDPPPVPTPAAPPAPPAPTAKFSAPVTADDAEVPPAGKPLAAAPPSPPTPSTPPAPSSAPATDTAGPRIVKPKGRTTDKVGPEDETKPE